MSLNNLGSTLITQFEQSGQKDDLDMAINTYCESLDVLISGHPNICLFSYNLGQVLMLAYHGVVQYFGHKHYSFAHQWMISIMWHQNLSKN